MLHGLEYGFVGINQQETSKYEELPKVVKRGQKRGPGMGLGTLLKYFGFFWNFCAKTSEALRFLVKPVFSGFCNFGHFWSRHPRRESGMLFSRICKMQKIVRSQRQSANGFFPFLAFLTKPVKNRYFRVSSFMFSGKLAFWTGKSRFLDPLREMATRGILGVFGQKGVKMTTF